MNNKHDLIYEGKAKKIFTHDDIDKVKIDYIMINKGKL